MNLIIWGTGYLFQKYQEYLLQFHIVKLCDSDTNKQGKYIHGIEIISPGEIEKYEYSYIVIMAYAIPEIYQKLVDMRVPADKILTCSQIYTLQNQPIFVQSEGKKMLFDEWQKKNGKAVLILSHEFSYSGVPAALKNMALIIRTMGYSVLMAAAESGNFIKELELFGLDYLDDINLYYGTACFQKMLSHFEVIIAGTFALYRIVDTWDKVNAPILWWIHESQRTFYDRKTTLPQNKNIKYLAGGSRVKRVFEEYYPDKNIEELQYCIPDIDRKYIKNHNRTITIAAIGAINQRKAQDILLDAIEMLPEDYKRKFRIIIIGRISCPDKNYIDLVEKGMAKISRLEWFEELSQEELDLYYENIDVLVCASRDDPMPVVVTQAMMHRKVCIVSDQTGQAEFIVPKENGLVFKSEDRQGLKEALIWVADHRERIPIIGQNARKIYEREFSEEVMKEKLSAIFQNVLYKGS